jgi:hypothetical protein
LVAISRHLSYFDQLRQDMAYAGLIVSDPKNLISSHTVKTFFRAFSWPLIWSFGYIHLAMFMWRLQNTKPGVTD